MPALVRGVSGRSHLGHTGNNSENNTLRSHGGDGNAE